MLIRVIDFETTGIPSNEASHAVCEVGWCDVVVENAEARISTGGHRLCDPGRPMPAEAMAVHHITDRDIATGGEAGRRACPPDVAFRRIMEDEPEIFAAHNAEFEKQFFGGGGKPWLCTYKAALRVWPDAPSHSNSVLRYWLGLNLDARHAMPPHRAGPDAFVTAHILVKLIEAGASIEDMLRWSTGPALLPRITFGKHRGAKWQDVPSDYLEWVANKSDLDADAKANARHHLKSRLAK
jgi:exodeoxyribonuclease X